MRAPWNDSLVLWSGAQGETAWAFTNTLLHFEDLEDFNNSWGLSPNVVNGEDSAFEHSSCVLVVHRMQSGRLPLGCSSQRVGERRILS